jgi:hypothetical protein
MFTPSLRPGRVQRVLGVDERRHAAELLGVATTVQRERRLARRLRPEDLDDAARRDARAAQREVEREAPVEMPGIVVRDGPRPAA